MVSVHALAGRRGKAYAIDCFIYLGIAAATIPLGLITQRTEWGSHQAFVLAASAVPPILATALAAFQESGPFAATPGKRRYDLHVTTTDGGSLTFGRALLRNSIKIAIPWQLGHTVAVGAAFGGFEDLAPLTIGASIATYPLLAAMIITVTRAPGHAIHDRLVGSRVHPIKTRVDTQEP